ncbi:MAG: hypothetical protein LAT55_05410 [Opitutales bacterium]|nr:hypothetical protein [Opitutales bacterium]
MAESSIKTDLGQALPENCGVCVINLDRRSDRWEDLRKEMFPHLRSREVQRISAIEGVEIPGFGKMPYFRGRKRDRTWAARAGCTLSHRKALLHAQKAGWSHVLVLEDDIHMPVAPPDDLLLKLREQITAHSPDVFYFGFTDPVPPFKKCASIGKKYALHQVFGCNTAHAYLVSVKGINHILSLLPSEQNIWRWLRRYRTVDRFYYRHLSPTLKVMAVCPTIIDQKAGFSDIMRKPVGEHAEKYSTTITSLNPTEAEFTKALLKQAAAFARADKFDCIRGFWKSFRGF